METRFCLSASTKDQRKGERVTICCGCVVRFSRSHIPSVEINLATFNLVIRISIVKPIRVLTATIPDALSVLGEAYPTPEFQYTAVLTLAEAIEQFEQPYDVIACSVHFNDGQFYDLLRMVKAHPVARNAPFLVHFTGMESKHHYITQSVEIASKALGAAEIVPIYQWRSELGNEAAFKRYREVIRRWIGR